MRTTTVWLSILFLYSALTAESPGAGFVNDISVTKQPNAIVIRNSVMKREIRFADGKPSAVVPAIYQAAGKGEITAGGPPWNWFELPIDGRRITNRDVCWEYDGYTKRGLTNGGIEVRIRFNGSGPPAASLQLDILLQAFPRSTVCREKTIFRTRPGTTARLTPRAGSPLFVFPGYLFRRESAKDCTTRSISLASWGKDLIPEAPGVSFDERTLESGTRIGRNLAQNYMYHPVEVTATLSAGGDTSSTCPVLLARGLPEDTGILFAYEHGAPDNDPEQEYILIQRKSIDAGLEVRTVYSRGAYCRDQLITNEAPFESVWNVLGTFGGPGFAGGESALHRYLLDQITEAARSRKPYFYYNTWGMQRDEERRGVDIRGVLTVERVLREIALASKLGVDIFVLDDGWQDRFGDWNPDPRRYPDGLRWYVKALKERGIIPGLWLASLATDPEGEITRAHPEWLIRDENNRPVIGRWNKNVFCFDSDYRDYFIRKCKERIDDGVRYFKWDGIDKHLCASALHHHGTGASTPDERKERQGYDLPLLVADAIRQLTEYEPDVFVEIDVTEPHRSVGLAILSQGKYFWMNNGASAYGDYSTHRAKSMRFITNLYHRLFPLPLQAFANYPHNSATYASWRHNVNSSLIGGWGFWGNLTVVDSNDLERTGRVVGLSKRVLREVASLQPTVTGGVGASPEIYELVDRERAVGQVIAFSGSALQTDYVIPGVRRENLLAVLHNAYAIRNDTLILPLSFPMPEASREAFIVPNEGAGIRITSSTSWMEDARVMGADTLRFVPGAPGSHVIEWDRRLGTPVVTPSSRARASVVPGSAGGPFSITVSSATPRLEIMITGSKQGEGRP